MSADTEFVAAAATATMVIEKIRESLMPSRVAEVLTIAISAIHKEVLTAEANMVKNADHIQMSLLDLVPDWRD